MYKMPYFAEHDQEAVIDFMRAHDFAFVNGIGSEFPVATQLPLEIISSGDQLSFTGHMMRKTDHHLAFEKNRNVLVVFHSPHAYINANWYTEPAGGSTVNYMSVHAKGIIHFLDEAGTRAAVEAITIKHIGTGTPASFENIPEDYIASMVKAIVGFRIEVTAIQNVFKLSQNRSAVDQQSIIQQLQLRGKPGDIFIAEKMKQRQ
ncbi:MAG: FMN-binding negative transcriptional regulator [Chitinophagaceae bacterium]|nr:MAG: FMN-binding negative transcriptional regulator [Chitinophagaceae bacterium]